jgi:hypothetical protein
MVANSLRPSFTALPRTAHFRSDSHFSKLLTRPTRLARGGWRQSPDFLPTSFLPSPSLLVPILPVPHDDSPAQFGKIVSGDRLGYALLSVDLPWRGWRHFVQHGLQFVKQFGSTRSSILPRACHESFTHGWSIRSMRPLSGRRQPARLLFVIDGLAGLTVQETRFTGPIRFADVNGPLPSHEEDFLRKVL